MGRISSLAAMASLFLSPDAALPALDISATTEQRETLVRELHAALAARHIAA
jgi:hypothetical protein